MAEDGEVGPPIRVFVGLLPAAPLNAELRAAHEAEDKAAAEKAAAEAEAREQLEFERGKEREFFGVEERGVRDVLLEAAVGAQAANVRAGVCSLEQALNIEDRREQARDARLEREAAERAGRPPRWPGLLREAKEERLAKQAELESTPASKAEVERKFDKLKTTIENTFGKRLLK
jgi:hypothetical protein